MSLIHIIRLIVLFSSCSVSAWSQLVHVNSGKEQLNQIFDLPSKNSHQVNKIHLRQDPHPYTELASNAYGSSFSSFNEDFLNLRSTVAYVIDQDTKEVLIRKNDSAILPIASITKLMTAIVVREFKLPMNETLSISYDDVDTEKGSTSRLRPGVKLTRGEMLHLALMSSENRAAHALGRTFPLGIKAFVHQMNLKALQLGMKDTHFVEPTGLSSQNQSSAKDLAILVAFAAKDPVLRRLSTSDAYEIEVGRKVLTYKTTNKLVTNPVWNIDLQKTGYISEAGQCLVMQAQVAGRRLIMVFLDSVGKKARLRDAEAVRKWVERRYSHPSS